MLHAFKPKDIYLNPGEFAFGSERTQIRTLLGSCVAITFWHPQQHYGAMCHYLLPERPSSKSGPLGLDGRYAEEAIHLILTHFRKIGLAAEAFEVKMFGGSNMFPQLLKNESAQVGDRNILRGRELLKDCGFRLVREDLSGEAQRMVIFEVWSGTVWVRQGPPRHEDPRPEKTPHHPSRKKVVP